MADFLKNILGGASSSAPSVAPSADDADFADFAGAPDPSPISITAATASIAASESGAASSPTARSGLAALLGTPRYASNSRPYTKWYRVWERTTLADFYQELFLMPFLLIILFIHYWGTRANRRRARQWMSTHAPILQQEYASIGFDDRKTSSADAGTTSELVNPEELLKGKAANEYLSYATGRQNVAFTDIKLTLVKRYNPLLWFGENALAFVFESMQATQERLEAVSYVFDGKEKQLLPRLSTQQDEDQKPIGNSSYDGFVWAVVHKDAINRLRKDRYDLSLTSAKEHAKLPVWSMVLSESAEITDALLTNDFIKAINEAGEDLEAIIVTDQPIDQPKTLNDCIPRKRVSLNMKLPSSGTGYQSTLPVFQYFLRIPDHLASIGRFRPEAMRRVRQTREDEVRKIKREVEKEREEEKKLEGDKGKKEKRDALLKNMSAEEQRKYLEKEREKDMRRSSKRRTIKG
ncbi:DUF1682-domain-containing protein [Viridothelium virens]|uniref:DUF1682-domain-containing protein n=1 Tax=Viridothelium virens TaxID=1048519 RepID=A0A6A6H251_VIRVR|nr:DUF1682-domain-containing protein [Viridothelium virens]